MTAASRPVTFDEERIVALASALREAWEEIDQLMAETVNPSLDEALNSGTGDYKP